MGNVTRDEAIDKIQEACKQIALQMMKIQPTTDHLGDEETQAEITKAAYKLTIELEVIKKKLIRLQQRDDSSEL